MARKKGTNGSDKFSGTSANDEYDGLAGNDKIDGNGGNDKLYGGADNDRVIGGSGNDKIYGEDGDDNMIGGAGNDTVDGGAGNDTLNGAKADDKIVGGLGLDTLSGGSGADHFYFKEGETGDFTLNQADTITDFNGAEGDRIRLRGVTGFDGNTASPTEDHYGIWNSGVLGWVVTYRDNGQYHDIAVGLQDPTGYVFSY
jgi:Ca2+-binding RTX toxin-like protein